MGLREEGGGYGWVREGGGKGWGGIMEGVRRSEEGGGIRGV